MLILLRMRLRVILLATTLVGQLAVNTFGQQGAPRLPGTDITGATQLTTQQIDTVRQYASHWTTILMNASSTVKDVEEARKQLLRPFERIQVSQDFRYTYSNLVTSLLKDAIQDRSVHAATNAVVVLSQLGTEDALNALVSHCDPSEQSSWQKRAISSKACRRLFQSDSIDPRRILASVQSLKNYASRETNEIVLQHVFETMNAADKDSLNTDDRRTIRSHLLVAAIETIDDIHKNNNPEPNPRVSSVGHVVVMLRDKFISPVVPGDERSDMGRKLAPALGKLLAVIESNWQAGQEDPKLKSQYGTVIGASEALLAIIDSQIRGPAKAPRTNLQSHWDNASSESAKEMFSSDLTKWRDILSQSPYS